MRIPPWLGDGLALVAGLLLVLAYAPFSYGVLAVPLLALFLWLCLDTTPGRAARRGALFGLGWFGAGIYWIYISLHTYGHAPAAFAVLATFCVVLVMLLYPAAFGWLLARLTGQRLAAGALLLAPALWVLLEWVRSWLFTGFPWLAVGYSQIDTPLAGFAPLLGVFGVGWAVMLSAGALLRLVQGVLWEKILTGLLLVALWGGGWLLGTVNWTTPAGAPFSVALVQGNVPQDEKFSAEGIIRALRLYAELSRNQAAGSQLVVWPETAIPVFYQELPDDLIATLSEQARAQGADYLSGVPTGNYEQRLYYNAVVKLGESPVFYHKRRLLPFGEFIPLRVVLNFFSDFVDIPLGDFTPGTDDQPLLQAAGYAVGVSICFEAVFGSEIRKSLPEAQYLVNVSNDAWFGVSLAPYQHLEIARMRALEAGRYMARATNTGVSALIDHQGRVLTRSGLFQTEVIKGELEPRQGATPYVRFGDNVSVGLAVGLLLVGLWFRRNPPRHSV